jgi:hypothetical protein
MIHFVWEQLLGQFSSSRDIKGWLDTNALRRVGVELDPEWKSDQAGTLVTDPDVSMQRKGGLKHRE